jgi:hypothetical protein
VCPRLSPLCRSRANGSAGIFPAMQSILDGELAAVVADALADACVPRAGMIAMVPMPGNRLRACTAHHSCSFSLPKKIGGKK